MHTCLTSSRRLRALLLPAVTALMAPVPFAVTACDVSMSSRIYFIIGFTVEADIHSASSFAAQALDALGSVRRDAQSSSRTALTLDGAELTMELSSTGSRRTRFVLEYETDAARQQARRLSTAIEKLCQDAGVGFSR